ncbi:hypothetical protein LTR36_003054 [Oleoguttula mirabilis]|uniref:Uncharacterized protein n=1 Tax=Oleoguttula mirabilis TaxID=1507867 RepID=A0AAV9JWG1_9PEZI|nr:hypothetical protein LTR36_003054 [Oleoguttula mirabilis]
MAWTPTKALCQKVRDILAILQPLVPTSTPVDLHVQLHGLPDPDNDDDDPHTVWCTQEPWAADVADLVTRLCHLPTIRAEFASTDGADGARPWAGNLHLRFAIRTMLYCTVAANSAELWANRQARLAGQTEEVVVQPVCGASRESVHWDLHATDRRGQYPGVLADGEGH